MGRLVGLLLDAIDLREEGGQAGRLVQRLLQQRGGDGQPGGDSREVLEELPLVGKEPAHDALRSAFVDNSARRSRQVRRSSPGRSTGGSGLVGVGGHWSGTVTGFRARMNAPITRPPTSRARTSVSSPAPVEERPGVLELVDPGGLDVDLLEARPPTGAGETPAR